MPAMDPPHDRPATPRCVALPAGSFLWRVESSAHPLFRDRQPGVDSYGVPTGGRFDPTHELPFTYLYAGLDDLTAVCETLLRDVAFGEPLRYLLRAKLRGLSLVLLETTKELRLASLLEAADLAAVRQDTWLVHAEQHAYPITRRWGHWVRGPLESAGPDGMVWPSKRNPTGRVVILFGDRCGTAVRRCDFGSRRLDRPPGSDWLDRRLDQLSTRVRAENAP